MRLTRAVAGAVLAAILLAAGQQPALAGGGGGGGLFGGVSCGQSYVPSCAVTAGSGPAAGTPPGTGRGAPARPGNGTTASGSRGHAGVPGGCRNTAARLACPAVAAALFGLPGGAGLSAPAGLAELAREYLVLPSPVIVSSPAQAALQLVRLPTWLWVAPAEWAARSKTAAVPGESVTATATPVSVTWRPGDGSTVTCIGPGTPYTSVDSPSSPSPDCGHTYTASSAGQPDGAYKATATITWDVTWRATAGGAGGVLPPLHTTAVAQFRVAESQALDTTGGG
jgi:hypothetical protein